MNNNKCFVVTFATGEYADSEESITFITPFESQAQLYVEKANEWLKENGLDYLSCKKRGFDYKYTNELQKSLTFPNWMQVMCDYTGGEFYYSEETLILDIQDIISENKPL